MYGFCDSGSALPHGPAVAFYASYAILPALSVFPMTFALVDQCSILGAAFLLRKLMRWNAGRHIISMGQKQPDEPDGKR